MNWTRSWTTRQRETTSVAFHPLQQHLVQPEHTLMAQPAKQTMAGDVSVGVFVGAVESFQ